VQQSLTALVVPSADNRGKATLRHGCPIHGLPPRLPQDDALNYKPDQVPPLQDRVQDLQLRIPQLRRHDHRLQL